MTKKVFEKASLLCAQLKLNILDHHAWFWPAPNTLYDKESMVYHEGDEPSPGAHIRTTLSPGLRAYSKKEFGSAGIEGTEPSDQEQRSREGTVIVRAVVLL